MRTWVRSRHVRADPKGGSLSRYQSQFPNVLEAAVIKEEMFSCTTFTCMMLIVYHPLCR